MADCIIAGVTIPIHQQPVVVCLGQYYERTVLGPVPFAGVTWLQVELQLIAAGQRQLTEQFVAEPVVAAWVTKADFELCPRTIEEVGPVDVLLDQLRDAAGYRTYVNIRKLQSPVEDTKNFKYTYTYSYRPTYGLTVISTYLKLYVYVLEFIILVFGVHYRAP